MWSLSGRRRPRPALPLMDRMLSSSSSNGMLSLVLALVRAEARDVELTWRKLKLGLHHQTQAPHFAMANPREPARHRG